ncbi:MAG: nitronate monooxygenase [Solirubrobacteraceae bacterium]|nr:nitronate monooxygenase [Solirubrobacteraceae bacterium]
MRTPFTELIGCRLPIQQAGFDSLNVDLAAAVSAAGGLGMIGAPLVTADALAAGFDRIRTKTDAPVAVNFASPFFELERDLPALETAIERGVMVEFFYGDPDMELIERIHAGGALASWQVGSMGEALEAVRCGCDMVVVQGTEAGGHVRGHSGLLPLLVELLERVDVPVIAAGGITTPRALAAVLAAGAAGARLGTALVASEEADFHADMKQAVVEASGEDTVYTEVFSAMWPDAPHRVLRSAVDAVDTIDAPTVGVMEFGGEQLDVPRTAGIAPHARTTGNIGAMALFAGEGVGSVNTIRPAADIVRELVDGARELLRAGAALADD